MLPAGTVAVVDRAAIAPPAVFQVMQRLTGAGWDSLEEALNLGVGMVAVTAQPQAVVEGATAQGIPAWVSGQVGTAVPAGASLVTGTKGVTGGSVAMVGTYAVGAGSL